MGATLQREMWDETAHSSNAEALELGSDEQEKLAQYRLSVIEMAEAFGPSEAARRNGVKRHTLLRWRERYATDGLDGLKDGNRPRKPHPFKVDEQTESLVESYALQYPTESAEVLKERLEEEDDIQLSHVTIQRILKSKGLGQQKQRLAAYENWQQRFGKESKPLSRDGHSKLAIALRNSNPALKESDRENFEPGSQLFQFGFHRRSLERGNSIYVQVIVDPGNAMAWVEIQAKKKHYYAESFLRNTYSSYLKLGVPIRCVITNNGPEFCSDALFTWRFRKEGEAGLVHAYEHFLRSKLIAHGKVVNRHYYHAQAHIQPRNPSELYEEVVGYDIAVQHANGIVERFYNILRREFFDPVLREDPMIGLDELRVELASWLKGYNETFGHLHEGYPNFGQTPAQRLEEYLQAKAQDEK